MVSGEVSRHYGSQAPRMPRTGPSKSDIDFSKLDQGKAAVYGVGIFSGIITALFPLSVVKTRQMATPNVNPGFSGALEISKRMLAHEGLSSFYRGFSTAIVGAVPTRMVYLPVFETTRSAFKRQMEGHTALPDSVQRSLSSLCGGACASVVSSTIVVPIDVVSSRLMVETGVTSAAKGAAAPAPPASQAPRAASGAAGPVMMASSKQAPAMGDGTPAERGTSQGSGNGRSFSTSSSSGSGGGRTFNGLSMARHIVRTEGIAGLYRGIGMSLMTYTPSSSIWWSSYSTYQDTVWACLYDAGVDFRDEDVGAIMGVQAVSGMLAGVTSAVLTTPLDVVKTQLQVAGRCSASAHFTTWDTVQSIYRREGLAGFWRGSVPRMANVALWGTCMVSGYEVLKRACVKD